MSEWLIVSRKNPIEKNIQKYLREAYHLTTCSNGPCPDPRDREKVWGEFNQLAKKIFNKEI